MAVPILSGVGVVLDTSDFVFVFNSMQKLKATAAHRLWKRVMEEFFQLDLRNIKRINNGRL